MSRGSAAVLAAPVQPHRVEVVLGAMQQIFEGMRNGQAVVVDLNRECKRPSAVTGCRHSKIRREHRTGCPIRGGPAHEGLPLSADRQTRRLVQCLGTKARRIDLNGNTWPPLIAGQL